MSAPDQSWLHSALRKAIERNSEMYAYGFNLIIKEYARFPARLPLPCHMEHGWTPLTPPLISDLATCKELMLVFSKRRKEAWQRESGIPVEVMGAPFVLYRRMRNLTQKSDAKGTLAFACHSSVSVEAKYDVERFCALLKALPDDFRPVSVCLHHADLQEGLGAIFKQHGFEIVGAGNSAGLSFIRNLYGLLSRHRYAASNVMGSHTFYAVEMGLPFFLVGEEPVFINRGNDPNMPKQGKVSDDYYGRLAIELFSTGPIKSISEKQRAFVEAETGVRDCLSREDLHRVLWDVFKRNHYGRRVPVYLFLNALRKLCYGSRFQ